MTFSRMSDVMSHASVAFSGQSTASYTVFEWTVVQGNDPGSAVMTSTPKAIPIPTASTEANMSLRIWYFLSTLMPIRRHGERHTIPTPI